MENKDVKLLWEFNVQTERIETTRPDPIVIDKVADVCKIIDVVVIGDNRIVKKE